MPGGYSSQSLKENDNKALDSFCREYFVKGRGSIYRYLLRFKDQLDRDYTIEDVCQETYMRAIKALQIRDLERDPIINLYSWIKEIAKNTALEFLKRTKNRNENYPDQDVVADAEQTNSTTLIDRLPGNVPPPDVIHKNKEFFECIHRCMEQKLSKAKIQRAIWEEKIKDPELPPSDMARILGDTDSNSIGVQINKYLKPALLYCAKQCLPVDSLRSPKDIVESFFPHTKPRKKFL